MKSNIKDSKWINFLGGQELIFSLFFLFILGGVFWIFSKVPFIFYPLSVIFRNVVIPILLTLVLYYVLNPLINWLQVHGIERKYGIIGVFFAMICIFVLFILLITPILMEQVESLVTHFPNYLDETENLVEQLSKDSRFEEVIANGIEVFSQWVDQLSDNLEIYLENFIIRVSSLFASLTYIVLLF